MSQNTTTTTAPLLNDLLRTAAAAESFIAGFEGDELQEGIDEKLIDLRNAIAAVRADLARQNMAKLPEQCAARLPATNEPILIARGERGYSRWPGRNVDPDTFNRDTGVTPAQREAMMIGSMAGFDVPGANPDMHPDAANDA